MLFVQGHTYIAGADVPFFVSDGAIVDGAHAKGFDQVQIFDRDSFPISKLPPKPSGTSNDWNSVVLGRRKGPTEQVSVPSQVRWVVDTTPPPEVVASNPVPTPAPEPTPEPVTPVTPRPVIQATIPNLSWALPNKKPSGGPSLDVPSGLGMPVAVGLGVLGGITITWWGLSHMFSEGLTTKERRGILLYAGAVLGIWGASKFVSLEETWWFTVDGVASKAGEVIE